MKEVILDKKLEDVIRKGYIEDLRIEKFRKNYINGIIPIILILKNALTNEDRKELVDFGFEVYFEHRIINCISGWCLCENIKNLCKVNNVSQIYLSYISPQNIPLDFKKKDILKMILKGVSKKIISKVKKINNDMIPDYTSYKWQNQSKRLTSDIGSDILWKNNITGKNVKIGIVDTGINPNHLDIKSQNWLDWDNSSSKSKIIANKSFVNNDDEKIDLSGHGTGIAGLICGTGKGNKALGSEGRFPGIAPEAELIIAKAFNFEGEAVLSMTILAAIEWTILQDANIVCMFHDNDNRPYSLNHEDNDIPLAMLIKEATINRNVVFSFAAGNDGPFINSILFPASNSYGITTGASSQRQDFISNETESGFHKLGPESSEYFTGVVPFSARGASESNSIKPDLVMPGSNIVMPFNKLGVQSARIKMGHPIKLMNDEYYLAASGTSVSAATLAGSLALLVGYCKDVLKENYTVYRLKSFVLNTCRGDIGQAKWFKAVDAIPLEDTPKSINGSSSILDMGLGQAELNKAIENIDKGYCIYFNDSKEAYYQSAWKFSMDNIFEEQKCELVIFNNLRKNINIKININKDNTANEYYYNSINAECFSFDKELSGKIEEFRIPIRFKAPEGLKTGSYFTKMDVEICGKNEETVKISCPITFDVPYYLENKICLEKSIWSKGNSSIENGVFKSDWLIDEINIMSKENNIEIEVDHKEDIKVETLLYDNNYNLIDPDSINGKNKRYKNVSFKVYLATFITESNKEMKEYKCKVNIIERS